MRTADLLKFLSDSDLQHGTVNVEPFNLGLTKRYFQCGPLAFPDLKEIIDHFSLSTKENPPQHTTSGKWPIHTSPVTG